MARKIIPGRKVGNYTVVSVQVREREWTGPAKGTEGGELVRQTWVERLVRWKCNRCAGEFDAWEHEKRICPLCNAGRSGDVDTRTLTTVTDEATGVQIVKPMGRPRRYKEKPVAAMVYMPKEVVNRVRQVAAMEDKSLSHWVVEAVIARLTESGRMGWAEVEAMLEQEVMHV